MREILFRGKRIDNREWVKGFLKDADCINSVTIDNSVGFKTHDYFEVDPESVGQSLDFNDHHGDRIFEGDVVECYDYSSNDPEFGLDKKHIGVVVFVGNSFVLKLKGVYLDNWVNAERINIVGNIYDNPELIK